MWVATEDGVVDAAGALVAGTPINVRSLAVRDDGTLLAVAGEPATLHLWSGGQWSDVTAALGGAVPVAVRFVGVDAVLGTNDGVFRSINGGTTWTQAPTSDGRTVVGEPAIGPAGTLAWPLAGDGDVIISRDGGASWSAPVAVGGGVGSFAALPGGRLAAIGANGFVQSADNGATWTAFTPAPSITATGVVYSDAADATFVWSADCKVARLADPPA